ncbi:hypothetical protein [Paenibacillus sp. 22594]|uniref:hypothetical protein n=1 Tax=Paenibacillus sp. 22594 TaxID=3453947 RepID=UPI003F87A818
MLKMVLIVKEAARRMRYSEEEDDIRLEGDYAALFIQGRVQGGRDSRALFPIPAPIAE